MKEEIKRILMMVQEGKISADDAAELIDAFKVAHEEVMAEEAAAAGPGAPGPGTAGPGSGQGNYESTAGKDPFRAFVETMERFGRETMQGVNWQEVSKNIRQSAKQGLDSLKHGLEEVAKTGHFNIFGNSEMRESTLPLSLPNGGTLRIENHVGQIKVVGGFDHSTVYAKAWFHGVTAEETKRKADEWTLFMESTEERVLIRQSDVANISVDIEVQLSGTAKVEIVGESGDVTILDTKEAASVTVRSGDVRLRGLQGMIDLDIESGDVVIEDSAGPTIKIENKSGDLRLERVGGNLSLKTISGDIRVENANCPSISMDTVSGDARVELTNPIEGNLNVRTVSGDAEVRVGPGSDARVSLSSLRGDIDCNVELLDVVSTEQRITGRLGSGKGAIDVSAVSGDVEFRVEATFF